MSKNLTFTKEIRKELMELATSLPPMPYEKPDVIQFKGTELLARGITQVKRNQIITQVVPEGIYKQKVPLLYDIDHFANLQSMYINGGFAAVMNYYYSIGDLEAKARAMYPQLFEDNGRGKYKGVKPGTLEKINPAFAAAVKNQAQKASKINGNGHLKVITNLDDLKN